ncbi:hypothetical protein FQA39_LY08262 [Lamprigera yunnana]|nr:hypothetical protein FQA39_LY08262 [Lamprigera yunnana]
MLNKQKLCWIILLLWNTVSCENTTQENKEVLVEAEAKDGLEIVKTIKKINNDGSYTIGYESDDGSFKIESRDVLGNIKGTYGYIDDNGEIKRVSYTSNNFTSVVSELPSVVQRIPKTNKTTTKRPSVLVHNPSSSSITTMPSPLLSKRRMTTQTTTTPSLIAEKPNKMNSDTQTTSETPNIVYATSAPLRNIIYQRPLVRSTVAPQTVSQKSEGQISRPETYSGPSTELPAVRRLTLKNSLADQESPTLNPVASEIRSNLLRRQSNPNKVFDPRQHIVNLQQSLGEDAVDVYSSSLTTGTSRPLFTTTFRPKPISNPPIFQRDIGYSVNLSNKQEITTEYAQESTTDVPIPDSSTSKQLSRYQLQSEPPPLVPVENPYQERYIIVPVNQIQVPEQQYIVNDQYLRQTNPSTTPTPTPIFTRNSLYITRPPPLKAIPIQVNQNGYFHNLQPEIIQQIPYQVQRPILPTQEPYYSHVSIDNEVNSIKPPVSVRDFQKLIEILLQRQQKLEIINMLIHGQRHKEIYNHPIRNLPPLFVQKQEIPQNEHHAFLQEFARQNDRHFVPVSPHHQQRHLYTRQPSSPNERLYSQSTQTSLRSTRRVPRLLSGGAINQEPEEEYLPPQIREMLLLRMLQLAINPSLPLDSNEIKEVEPPEFSEQRVQNKGVRNVEVLGEEEDQTLPNSKY